MLKIGEYFRTPWGDIGKITDIPKHNPYFDDGFILDNKHFIECGKNAMKELESTPNIMDLIEVGDYVNGKLVIDTYTDYIFDYTEEFKVIRFSETDILHNKNYIKSIVTKEMFESIEYRIGD